MVVVAVWATIEQHPKRRWSVAAFLAGVTVLAPVGCAGGPGEVSRDVTPAGAGATATLPAATRRSFDLFLGEQAGLLELAQQRIRNRCLAAAGFPQNLDAMLVRAGHIAPSLVITDTSFGWASEEEARARGFGRDRAAQPPRIVSFDPAYDSNLRRCTDEAWAAIASDARTVWEGYRALGNTLTREFFAQLAERMPRQLTEATLDCLSASGHRVRDREAFLADGDPRHFGIRLGGLVGADDKWVPRRIPGTLQIGPATPALRYRPTEEESQFAVDFHRCDQRTGRVRRLLELTDGIQQQVIRRHEGTLAELNPRLEQLVRTASVLGGTG
jgi:hypothetical protein